MLSDMLERRLKQVQNPTPIVVEFATPASGQFALTDKQISFYKTLVNGKQLSDDQRALLKGALGRFDRRTVQATFDWLIGLPWTPKPTLNKPTTPTEKPIHDGINQGYYAVVDPQDNVTKFFQVRRPTAGNWKGYVFLSAVSGENHLSIRDQNERDRIYGLIAKDILGALKLFGQKIGKCGHCRKQLTDEVSREFGIGPVCRKALGI